MGVSSWRAHDGAPTGRETEQKVGTAGSKQCWDAQMVFQLSDSLRCWPRRSAARQLCIANVAVAAHISALCVQHLSSSKKSDGTSTSSSASRYIRRTLLFPIVYVLLENAVLSDDTARPGDKMADDDLRALWPRVRCVRKRPY